MSDTEILEAESRDRVGKGASRAVRRAGLIPAVIYGGSKKPESIQLPYNRIKALINKGHFLSQTFKITVDGGKKQATVLPRDLQLDPANDLIMHIDFLRLEKGATVVVNVPVHVVGEEESPGVKRGGVVTATRHEVELDVPADDIPEELTISVAGLDINEAVKISDVDLPKGCQPTITDRDFTILTISAPSSLKSEEGAEEEEAEEPETTVQGAGTDDEGEEE
ncbi:50S ribosomal protein L25/general stress protein Ctc [Yunchengibacter salinarum]|uniref:50S ribosomal protein L25/general stress protein Ctc n=1 Tax=Yunchengibacter salinarum TaxID=3133399 RepID=UPI0035B63147